LLSFFCLGRRVRTGGCSCRCRRVDPPVDPVIAFDKFQLENGLTVIVHDGPQGADRRRSTSGITSARRTNSRQDRLRAPFEHLMFQGSENFNDEYFKPFEAGRRDGHERHDQRRPHNYFQNVPTTRSTCALWMESTAWATCWRCIDQKRLDEQRGVVQNEKRQGENRPHGRVPETIFRASFPPGIRITRCRSARWRT
jgi:zinc protease